MNRYKILKKVAKKVKDKNNDSFEEEELNIFQEKDLDNLILKYQDQLKGGLGDKRSPYEFDREQLIKGINVEFEHTTDPMMALSIVLDHLAEHSDYYSILLDAGL